MDRLEEDTMLREIGLLYLRLIAHKDLDETPGNNTQIQLHRMTDNAIKSGLPRSREEQAANELVEVDW